MLLNYCIAFYWKVFEMYFYIIDNLHNDIILLNQMAGIHILLLTEYNINATYMLYKVDIDKNKTKHIQ